MTVTQYNLVATVMTGLHILYRTMHGWKWVSHFLCDVDLHGAVIVKKCCDTSIPFLSSLLHHRAVVGTYRMPLEQVILVSLSLSLSVCPCLSRSFRYVHKIEKDDYRGADKTLARPGRKQATATKLLQATQKKKNQKVVCTTRSPRQQWPPRRTKNGDI